MTEIRDKARALRLERLAKMLSERLTQAPAALEILLDELGRGELRPQDWDALHGAAARDGQEIELGTAYQKVLTRHRMAAFTPEIQARVLLQAATFFQGILGDTELAEQFLERVLEVHPSHAEAFDRLERRRRTANDRRGLVRLYSLVASAPPIPVSQIATRVTNELLVPLPAATPLSDETCRRLLLLVPLNLRLLDLLDEHCKSSGRSPLGCELRERVLANPELPEAAFVPQRRRLLERYLEGGNPPPQALDYAEQLLARSPNEAVALQAVDKLLRVPAVATRAAALLRDRRLSGRSSNPPPRR